MGGSGIRVVQRHRRRAQGERGAVLIVTALALVALVGALALSVDIGYFSYTKRNLQTIADAAAMDARFALGQANACTVATTLADESASRNGFSLAANSGNTLTVTLGNASVVNGAETFTPDVANTTCAGGDPDQATATAVYVRTTGNVQYYFESESGSSTPAAGATWTEGSAIPETGVSIGTNLVGLDTTQSEVLNSLLSGLLGPGSNIDLTAVGYQGLVNSDVTLGELATALNVGSVSQLLTTTVTYPELVKATIQALGAGPQGPTAEAGLSFLNLIDLSNLGGSFPVSFSVGQLLGIQDPGTTPDAADINTNVLNLVTAAAEIAHGSSAISIPLTGLDIPGLTDETASVTIGEPAQSAYGPVGTEATDAQVTVNLQADVSVAGLLTVTVPLSVKAGQGTATLDKIPCSGSPTIGVNTDAVTLSLGSASNPVTVSAPVLLGSVQILSAYGNIGVASATGTTLKGPYPETLSGDVASIVDPDLGNLNVKVLGLLDLGGLLDSATGVLQSVLNPVLTGLVDPLLNGLGVAVDGGVVGNPDPVTSASCSTNGFLF